MMKRYTLEDAPSPLMELPKARLLYANPSRYSEEWDSFLHTHANAEFFYVVSGLGQFQIEDQVLSVSAGDVVIISPNVEHTERGFPDNPMEYIVLGVDGFELGTGEDTDDRFALLHFHGRHEVILHDMREILREMELQEPGCGVVCQSLLEVMMVRMVRMAGVSFVPAATSRANKECALVRRYIDSHFKESISLDQLAQLAHVNKYYMVHSFSTAYGISPINYLISRRIAESKYLLADTDLSLSQISHTLGFSSPSYFSQSFRRQEGVTPLEYRRAAHHTGRQE